MSNYFAQKGQVWYRQEDGSQILLNDITTFATFSDTWRKDVRTQMTHSVRDGELPHMISFRLYGTVDYWWTILLLNNIYDFDEQWPRSYEVLNDYIDRKYPGQNRNDVHHYINPNGLVADLLSLRIELGLTDDAEVINQAGLEAVSIEEFEIAVNENKRNIILVDPDYISSVQREYDNQMNPEV
jgi:hypothetical protein